MLLDRTESLRSSGNQCVGPLPANATYGFFSSKKPWRPQRTVAPLRETLVPRPFWMLPDRTECLRSSGNQCVGPLPANATYGLFRPKNLRDRSEPLRLCVKLSFPRPLQPLRPPKPGIPPAQTPCRSLPGLRAGSGTALHRVAPGSGSHSSSDPVPRRHRSYLSVPIDKF
jgi:hypothetical protein